MQKETFEVEYEYEGERLDKYVSILFPEQSRSFFQKLIKDGNVSVNDKVQKANYRLKTEDLVTVEIPDAVETQILPEDIPLDILYEDDDLLVVNKPKGMVVHPSAGHYSVSGAYLYCVFYGYYISFYKNTCNCLLQTTALYSGNCVRWSNGEFYRPCFPWICGRFYLFFPD